ncbi:amino acid ABC transporter, amino acid-binding protein [Pediococcus damnosus]|uniref:Amino acid ABC transporter, amino acid-binding protein n=1 Tax=Pediococcus damnosus TaxID=51663 RepID=A0A143AXQ4_9LACO|nr:amino acid ABC transporter substrate-binding protein [Pediococcus damnosus]AMV62428.1 amino acid ABC transporter, amino acid-binding protein [Pediococcus damnosus]AMV67707.1 amino acid ABC transporter, amino acid-binding protein [Pediococcus damnosus]AMV68966.1 amino acid ABC transporter, amino acid-binding protein [Pediococcus damnosus]PIO80746.1 amino acid ABC transporter substrate-binding protein [Pediococcus damnosus]PIO85694.1 amino acid ABC transporter substrate-binding protein [Pedio
MKKKLRLIFLMMAVCLVLLPSLSGCENATKRANTTDYWQTIKKRGTVVVGLDDSFVPMGFREKNGKLTGYDIDLAKAVFKLYGIKVDFQSIDWSMNTTELRNRTIDLIWNGFTVTPARAKVVSFSHTYLANQQVLVSKRSQNITSFQKMTGKTLGVQSGSSGAEDVDKQPQLLKNKIKNKTPILYDSFNDAFIDLGANRIQGLLIDDVYAGYYIKKENDPNSYREIQGSFPKEQFAVGIRKGDVTLRKKINHGLYVLYKNGTLKKINEKWFGNTAPVEKQPKS